MRNNLPNKAIPQPHWMLQGVMVLMPNSRWPELQVALIPSIPTFSPSQRYSHGCCRKVVWKDSISYSALGIRGFSPSVPLLASRSATYQELCLAHLTVSSVDISSSLFISDIPPRKNHLLPPWGSARFPAREMSWFGPAPAVCTPRSSPWDVVPLPGERRRGHRHCQGSGPLVQNRQEL